MTEASEGVQLGITKDLTNPSNVVKFGGGWQAFIPQISGNFGSDFAARAFIAETGLAQLTTDVVLYPEIGIGSKGSILNVGPNEAAIFTFSRKPPVRAFWSLTAYGPDSFLIPNPLNVYALGDRSNMTYSDGTPVYDSDGRDGEFQILIQPADVIPPKNWTNK